MTDSVDSQGSNFSKGTLKILAVMAALATLGGLLAALDNPDRLRSWGGLVVGVLLCGYLLREWRRLPESEGNGR